MELGLCLRLRFTEVDHELLETFGSLLCRVSWHPSRKRLGNWPTSSPSSRWDSGRHDLSQAGKRFCQARFDKLTHCRFLTRPWTCHIQSQDLVVSNEVAEGLSCIALAGMEMQARLIVLHSEFDRLFPTGSPTPSEVNI